MINCSAIPSLGMLMGNVGSQSVIQSFNNAMNMAAPIDNWVRQSREIFTNRVVEPMANVFSQIKNHITLNDVDLIRPITNLEMLTNISPAMYQPILSYAPVRTLWEQGRIDGFDNIEPLIDDPYARLISNGQVDNILEAMDDDDCIECVSEYYSTDPDIDFDEIDAIEESRRFIDELLEQTSLDPTNPSKRRG
jgi:hypothetical protein